MQCLIIVSCSASLLENFGIIMTAKCLQGFAAGVIVHTSNVFIAETCPPKRLGLFGSLVNIGIVAGLSVYFLQGLFIPEDL